MELQNEVNFSMWCTHTNRYVGILQHFGDFSFTLKWIFKMLYLFTTSATSSPVNVASNIYSLLTHQMVKQVLPEGPHHWCKTSRILPNCSDSIFSPHSPTFTSISCLRKNGSCMEGCSEHFCQDATCALENGTHEHRENRNWIWNCNAESASFIQRVSHSQSNTHGRFILCWCKNICCSSVIIQNLTSGRVCVFGGSLSYTITLLCK